MFLLLLQLLLLLLLLLPLPPPPPPLLYLDSGSFEGTERLDLGLLEPEGKEICSTFDACLQGVLGLGGGRLVLLQLTAHLVQHGHPPLQAILVFHQL